MSNCQCTPIVTGGSEGLIYGCPHGTKAWEWRNGAWNDLPYDPPESALQAEHAGCGPIVFPYSLAEAEALARQAGQTTWWAARIVREYDRRGEVLKIAAEVRDEWRALLDKADGLRFLKVDAFLGHTLAKLCRAADGETAVAGVLAAELNERWRRHLAMDMADMQLSIDQRDRRIAAVAQAWLAMPSSNELLHGTWPELAEALDALAAVVPPADGGEEK